MKTTQILTTLLTLSIASQCFGAGMSQKEQEKAAIKRFIQDIKTAQAQFDEKRAQAVRSEAQSIIPYFATLSEEEKAIALSEIEQLMTFFKPVKTEPMRKRETAMPQRRPTAPTRIAPKPITVEGGAAAKVAEAQGKVIRPIMQPSRGDIRRATIAQPTVQRAAVQKFVKPKPEMPSRKAPKRPESDIERKRRWAQETRARRSEKENQEGDNILYRLLTEPHTFNPEMFNLYLDVTLSGGANPNAIKDGKPIFWHMIDGFGNQENNTRIKDILPMLINYGANMKIILPDGTTFLHYTARHGLGSVSYLTERHLVKAFVAQGMDINARDDAGNTPLHRAASNYNLSEDFIDPLIQRGADINARNKKGETPLLAAVKRMSNHTWGAFLYPNPEAVQKLLEHNPDPFAEDRNGKQASDYINEAASDRYYSYINKQKILRIKKMLDDYKQSFKKLAKEVITGEELAAQRAKVKAQAQAEGREAEITEIPLHMRGILADFLIGE